MWSCGLAVALAMAVASPLPSAGPEPMPLWRECYDGGFMIGTPHGPIHIVGNGDFTAANGVVGGSGVPSNPYRIDGWRIYPNVTHGIWIENTSAYLTIGGVVICGGVHKTPPLDGIRLSNVTNVRVEGSDLPFNRVAINVRDSSNVKLINDWTYSGYPDDISRPPPYGPGIEVVNTSHLEIDGFSTYADYVEFPVGISISSVEGLTLRNAYLDQTHVGVRFGHVTNATIENIQVPSSGDVAIRGGGARNVIIRGSTLSWGPGIDLASSLNVTLERNRFLNNGYGIGMGGVKNATIVGNTFTGGGSWGGMGASHVDGLRIVGNVFAPNCDGASIGNSSDVYIQGNTFRVQGNCYFEGNGLTVAYSDRVTISENTFATDKRAVGLIGSIDVHVYRNAFTTKQPPLASDDYGPENQWDDGYPSGGNRWWDYRGPDRMKGPGQDEPGSDGIGDVPYRIDDDSLDRYPVVRNLTVMEIPVLPIRGDPLPRPPIPPQPIARTCSTSVGPAGIVACPKGLKEGIS